jgi:hypothetical protein
MTEHVQWTDLSTSEKTDIDQTLDTVTETDVKTTNLWNRVTKWATSYQQFLLGAAVGSIAVWCIRHRK